MRPRIRTVKPEVLKDEELWDLEVSTGLPIFRAFQGLWCLADREGRFEWRPRALKSEALPYWDGSFDAVLAALESKRFVTRYTVDGRDYGHVTNLTKHQRFDHKEPASILPAPPLPGPSEEKPGPSEEKPRSSSEGREGKGREQEGNRKGAELGRAHARGATPVPVREHEPTSSPEHTQIRPIGSGGVARTYSMPSKEPPAAYLEEATLRGVHAEQAKSTWEYYFGAGLPERGVERLYEWLLQRAKERANSQARAGPRGRSTERGDVMAMLAERREKHLAEEAAEEAAKGVSR